MNIILQKDTGTSTIIPIDYINQSLNSICKIIINGKNYISGFFLKFSIEKNIYYFLITTYNSIPQDFIDLHKSIEIKLKDNNKYSIELNKKKRKIICLKEHNILSIEILNDDEINTNKSVKYLSYDLNYLDGYSQYKKKKVFILPFLERIESIGGKILEINNEKDYEFQISLDDKGDFCGSPILLTYNNKVIGINTKFKDNNNYGTYIGELIDFLKPKKRTQQKIKIENLIELSKSICIIDDCSAGYFISIKKDLNFLLMNSLEYTQSDIILKKKIKIQIQNGKKYEIILNDKERLIKFLDKNQMMAIEILDTDIFKQEIKFLSCINYIDDDYYEYRRQEIIVFKFGYKSNFNDNDKYLEDKIICKFGEITNTTDKMYIEFKEIIDKNLRLDLVLLADNFKIMGIPKKEEKNNITSYYIDLTIIKDILKNQIQEEYLIGPKIPLDSINRVSKSICKIISNSFEGQGFFLKIKNDSQKELFYLINTDDNFIFLIEKKENIEIILYDGKRYSIKVDNKERVIKSFSPYEIMFAVEILDNDEVKNEVNYLTYDLNKNALEEEEIMFLFYTQKNRLTYASGVVLNIKENILYYSGDICETNIGSPIISINNLNLIGIHGGRHNNKKYVYYGKKIGLKFDKLISY